MDMDKKDYKKYSKSHAKKSPLMLDAVKAFVVGGAICVLAQALRDFFTSFKMSKSNVDLLVPVTFKFLTCIFTGIGVFDNLAKHAGAGTLVPITGFANAVVSPAIDYKAEGLVMGMAAKMFIIAGPVIVYGTLLSAIYGVIYFIVNKW
jgi:stage V sporulation protein AC